MEKFFDFNGSGEPFILFSESHIAAVSLIIIAAFLIYLYREWLGNRKVKEYFRYGLVFLIGIQEVILYAWYIYSKELSISYILPLQICDMSILLCIILLLSGNYPLYELTYFWGLGGAVQAVLTPDLGNFSFPHMMFFQFFISHGCIIITCIFMTVVEGLRPTGKSIWRVFAFTNVYAAGVAFVNKWTGGNYLYLCEKPQGGSVIDYLGPWPWYILSLEFVALALFFLCYLPFALQDVFSNKQGRDRSINF